MSNYYSLQLTEKWLIVSEWLNFKKKRMESKKKSVDNTMSSVTVVLDLQKWSEM